MSTTNAYSTVGSQPPTPIALVGSGINFNGNNITVDSRYVKASGTYKRFVISVLSNDVFLGNVNLQIVSGNTTFALSASSVFDSFGEHTNAVIYNISDSNGITLIGGNYVTLVLLGNSALANPSINNISVVMYPDD
jgi:hypothetical protein